MTMSWIETVADNAGLPIAEAEAMLLQRRIFGDRPARPTPTLTISDVAFKGEKQGKFKGSIDFSWSNLGTGVWAVASHGSSGQSNLVGKSSVLEIILWSLRGDAKALQDDVRSWLSWVNVSFKLDDRQYAVEFEVLGKKPNGALKRLRPDGSFDDVDRFSSDEGFAAAMSRFMMSTFDLEPISSRKDNDEGGITVSHGWTALSGALYFGGDHKALLGDILMAGLPGRMLQLYIGLPWASTVMQAGTAKKEVEQQLTYANRNHSARNDRASDSRERITKRLDNARLKLSSAADNSATAESLDRLALDLTEQSILAANLEQLSARAELDLATLRSIADQDERALRDLRENVITTAFFNGLEPSCCPRCEKSVPKERIKRETTDLSCSLCSEPINHDQQDDSSDALEAAESRAKASLQAFRESKENAKEAQSEAKLALEKLVSTQAKLAAVSASNPFRQQREAELDVARLEGALQEYTAAAPAPEPPRDASLIDIALKEAKKAFDASKGELMDALNEEILRLSNEFGALGLEAVDLGSDARMSVLKGGQRSWFSKLTTGERLRLRIATAIALLRVGQKLGVGRHPGLLIIDSPGSEETSERDLAKLLSELRRVAGETTGLQIFVASANAPAVISALGDKQCRVAPEGGYVW